MTTTAIQIIITDVEVQDDETGTTRGWIVPADTDPTAGMDSWKPVGYVDVPATEDEAEWRQNLRDELSAAGYALTGSISQDGRTVTAPVVRA